MIGIVRFPEEDGLQSALDHFDETQKRWFQLCIVGGSKCDLSVQARFIREVEDRGDSTDRKSVV